MSVKFHPDAEAELLEARRWYKERSAIAARAFETEVAWAIGKITKAPHRWKVHMYGTRRFFLPHFPFGLVYREVQNGIEIVAIAHHRRKPGYWIAR